MNFLSEFRLELMYIFLIVSIRSSLTQLYGFHVLVLLPLFIEIIFFCLYQQNKYSQSRGIFRQDSNYCKRFLESAKLTYANKTKESITSQKRGSRDVLQIANSVLNKDKSAIRC